MSERKEGSKAAGWLLAALGIVELAWAFASGSAVLFMFYLLFGLILFLSGLSEILNVLERKNVAGEFDKAVVVFIVGAVLVFGWPFVLIHWALYGKQE